MFWWSSITMSCLLTTGKDVSHNIVPATWYDSVWRASDRSSIDLVFLVQNKAYFTTFCKTHTKMNSAFIGPAGAVKNVFRRPICCVHSSVWSFVSFICSLVQYASIWLASTWNMREGGKRRRWKEIWESTKTTRMGGDWENGRDVDNESWIISSPDVPGPFLRVSDGSYWQ